MSTTKTTSKTLLFLGPTGGIGLRVLRHSLHQHTCICLVRNPSKLLSLLYPSTPNSTPPPNLTILRGNAHSIPDLLTALTSPNPSRLPDYIISSIGGAFTWSRLSLDDPHVCEKGMTALLSALSQAREKGISGRPHIVAVSTIGLSKLYRDIPIAMVPLYNTVLRVPYVDKGEMERILVASAERWTVVRPSLMVDAAEGEAKKKVRVGVEDPVGGRVERREVGYTISREDVAGWIYGEVVVGEGWEGRAVSLTW